MVADPQCARRKQPIGAGWLYLTAQRRGQAPTAQDGAVFIHVPDECPQPGEHVPRTLPSSGLSHCSALQPVMPPINRPACEQVSQRMMMRCGLNRRAQRMLRGRRILCSAFHHAEGDEAGNLAG
jgi:hypothetical protein